MTSESSTHWCKAVIEGVQVPTTSGVFTSVAAAGNYKIPPPPAPPTFGISKLTPIGTKVQATAVKTAVSTINSINPQYLQYYQQYYQPPLVAGNLNLSSTNQNFPNR
jgi:hypothetical protein